MRALTVPLALLLAAVEAEGAGREAPLEPESGATPPRPVATAPT